MNESHIRLDDLELFLATARAGSLSRAAETCGIPLPTLSRRMSALETQTGRKLFLRGKSGYALSAEGRSLAEEMADLPVSRRRLSDWLRRDHGPRRVRITAGFWTSRLIAMRLAQQPRAAWIPEFIPSNAALDLARREADIGIRNREPAQAWLARQRVRRNHYAIYGLDTAPEGFITLPRDAGLPASQRWVYDHGAWPILTTASDTRLCLDLARAGLGRVVLPGFVGDAEPTLTRLSDPIAALSHHEWLVSHHDARHDPPIRAALDWLADTLT